MTENKNTAMPGIVTKRKNGKVIAAALAGVLIIGGAVGGVTYATQMAAMEQDATYDLSRLEIGGNRDTLAFNLNEGATDTIPQTVTITHAGGTGVKAHAGFAPEPYTPLVEAALTDTMVRVWDTDAAGADKPWLNGSDDYWEGTLAEYLSTSFVSNKVLAAGETASFAVDMETPYDVDPVRWQMPEGSNVQETGTSSIVKLVVAVNPANNESSLSSSTTDNPAYGFRTGVAAELLTAAAPLVGAPVSNIAWDDDFTTLAAEGQTIRTFYTDPGMTDVVGTILLDNSKQEGDADYILDADYDGDGTRLSLYGTVEAG
nr:hypothetical protein [Microbacterium barkeri]